MLYFWSTLSFFLFNNFFFALNMKGAHACDITTEKGK